jgi:hypothetical protein
MWLEISYNRGSCGLKSFISLLIHFSMFLYKALSWIAFRLIITAIICVLVILLQNFDIFKGMRWLSLILKMAYALWYTLSLRWNILYLPNLLRRYRCLSKRRSFYTFALKSDLANTTENVLSSVGDLSIDEDSLYGILLHALYTTNNNGNISNN